MRPVAALARAFSPAIALAALLAFAGPAASASNEEIFQNIEALHGHAQDLDPQLRELQASAANGSAEGIADLIEYPISVRNNGEVYDISSREDFIADFDSLMAPETLKALSGLQYGDLIVNSEGVGVANGLVWFSAVCEDDACENAHWAIIAINN